MYERFGNYAEEMQFGTIVYRDKLLNRNREVEKRLM